MRLWTCVLSVALLSAGGVSSAQKLQKLQFNRDIRPILSENCFACHGPDRNKRQANLRLDQFESVKSKGILAPGHPERSALIVRINAAANSPMLMPPANSHKSLTQAQRATLVRWVKEGAEYQAHWAYIPPKRPTIPQVASVSWHWAVNPIDAFVLAKLAAKRIKPSPMADRRTLIRRVYLDLIGLPPSPKEVQDFLADKSPNAYEKVVDRLLANPHYGERMAVPWLDVVRYADTVGYHGDQNMNAWAYRDYVIDSYNKNKPFDQFTLEQIAGDLLPNHTTEQVVATCFNRLNMVTREGGAQPKEYLAKYQADRVRTVSMAWLGSTMGCTECHDHKYDPFKQKDFYSMAAFFADVKQWGVYQDYDYTPNPDLRGWSNDHPFPPEITIESPYLKQRIARQQEHIRQIALGLEPILQKEPGAKSAFEAWRKSANEFLSKHPNGWSSAGVELIGADGKPSSDLFASQADESILIRDKAPADLRLTSQPETGWLATLRLELLPHAMNGGTILRNGGRGGTLTLAAEIQRADGKKQGIKFRYAGANYHNPVYYNGFDILGVQNGWRVPSAHVKEPLDSVWIVDTPVQVSPGDSVSVTVKGVKIGCLRLSLSPFVPDDTDSPVFAGSSLDSVKNGNGLVSRANTFRQFLLGTGYKVDLLNQVKPIERDILECRHGKTPVMVVESTRPFTTRIFPRGNWQDESGQVVQPAVPEFLPHAKLVSNLSRSDLAKWLVSPDNPLTARVIVNRLWKQFFGTGLSDSVEDVGAQGEPPSNPELMDWLAVEFREGERGRVGERETEFSPLSIATRPGAGHSSLKLSTSLSHSPTLPLSHSSRPWDLKRMVKLIVMSATYRQSSKLRPELRNIDRANRLYSSQNPRRLDAEFVRDNAVSIAGLINLDIGGPPCHPYQPAGYYVNLQFPDRDYIPERDERQWRRGVYMHWQRTFLQPMLANFGAPSREECTAARAGANTPQQALTLLNDPEFVEAARAFAERLLAKPGTDAGTLSQAFEIALCRPPKPAEAQSMLGFLGKMRNEYKQRPDDAKRLRHVGFSLVPEQNEQTELAAWANVCRVILNLQETITRY